MVTEWISVQPHPSREGGLCWEKDLEQHPNRTLITGFHRFWQHGECICRWICLSRLEPLEVVLYTFTWGPLPEGSISGRDLRRLPLRLWEFHGWEHQSHLTVSSTVKPLKGLGGWKRASVRDNKHFLAQFLGQITVLCYTVFSFWSNFYQDTLLFWLKPLGSVKTTSNLSQLPPPPPPTFGNNSMLK